MITSFRAATNEDILKSLHPILKKELISLNKLDQAINEIKKLSADPSKMNLNSFVIIDEFSFLWPTIVSFGSEDLGISINIYYN